MTYNYEDYWAGEYDKRRKTFYYENLYGEVKKFFKFKPKDKILDIAGGNGHFASFIGIKKATIMDISESGLEFARKKFGYKTIKQNVYERWKIKENSFDVCFCNELLEHLKFPSLIIAEAYRVLKRGGILYVGQPNMHPDGEHHLKKIDLRYLKKILEENGFKIERYIIKPKYINNKLKNFSKKNSAKSNLGVIFGFLLGLFINKKCGERISKMFPNFFGGFYYLCARKD